MRSGCSRRAFSTASSPFCAVMHVEPFRADRELEDLRDVHLVVDDQHFSLLHRISSFTGSSFGIFDSCVPLGSSLPQLLLDRVEHELVLVVPRAERRRAPRRRPRRPSDRTACPRPSLSPRAPRRARRSAGTGPRSSARGTRRRRSRSAPRPVSRPGKAFGVAAPVVMLVMAPDHLHHPVLEIHGRGESEPDVRCARGAPRAPSA